MKASSHLTTTKQKFIHLYFAVLGGTGQFTQEWSHGAAVTVPAIPDQELRGAVGMAVTTGFFLFVFCFLSQYDLLDSQF